MIIDYSKLRLCDYILTSSRSLISCAIRKKTAGVWLGDDFATHAGLIVDIDGKFFMAEMLTTGLAISSIKKYLDPKLSNWYQHIVCIRRHDIYRNIIDAIKTQKHIISDYFETQYYDFKGVLHYIFPNYVSQDLNKYYCSEYLQKYAIKNGDLICNNIWECTPYNIQTAKGLQDVKDWKIE